MAPATNPNPWIAYHQPRPQAEVRLFCFPHAGGSAFAYREWVGEMPQEVEVCPVQLPGRERRLPESTFRRMEPLIDALMPALQPWLDKPFAFFGHSMGAAIAYELTQRLRSCGGALPQRLLISAREAPQLPPDEEPIYLLPDDEMRERLRLMNGTPAEVLDHAELMRLMMPVVRADFELNDTYTPRDHPPLDCPLTAFGGLADAEVSRASLEAWSEVTSGPFLLRMFSGDHFYLRQHQSQLIRLMAEELLGATR